MGGGGGGGGARTLNIVNISSFNSMSQFDASFVSNYFYNIFTIPHPYVREFNNGGSVGGSAISSDGCFSVQ